MTDPGGPEGGSKAALRAAFRAAWRALDPRQRAEAAFRATAVLLNRPEWARARTVGVFLALPDELPTEPLIAAAWTAGRRLAAPVLSAAGATMEFHELEPGWLRRGPHGIWQPDPDACARIPPDRLDLVVVPGLAFDRRGFRLGRGGGHYDRYLARLRPGAVRVGWTLARFVVPALPAEPHDQPVDLVVTEAGCVGPTGSS